MLSVAIKCYVIFEVLKAMFLKIQAFWAFNAVVLGPSKHWKMVSRCHSTPFHNT